MSTKISQGTDQVNGNKSVMVGDRLSQESQPTELPPCRTCGGETVGLAFGVWCTKCRAATDEEGDKMIPVSSSEV